MPSDSATTRQQLARVRAARQKLEWLAKERMEQAACGKDTPSRRFKHEALKKRWPRAKLAPDAGATGNLTDSASRLK
jgi:hypothetical protein